eukprot:COSAG02_NODE_24818_length_676_cov_2.630849_2_plen_46_part_00
MQPSGDDQVEFTPALGFRCQIATQVCKTEHLDRYVIGSRYNEQHS